MPTRTLIKYLLILILGWLTGPLSTTAADAFCGFYVAKADTKLFNTASKVIMARHDNKTVITMANDYQGSPSEFAMVVPVPTVLERDQIHVTEPAIIDHLDAYTSPRLVEYFDPNPCQKVLRKFSSSRLNTIPESSSDSTTAANSLGVTIEAAYTVGEYDILILSATESAGLTIWLTQNGYRLPDGADRALSTYLTAGMKFFVAKVNLTAHNRQGARYLRPLQMAFESDHFMLPIRLGTLNANGPQELFIFALTRNGRVESSNYQTRKLPSDVEIPVFVKHEFGEFYRALFDEQVKRDAMQSIFLEYAWDMGWCDPCAADPLSVDELRELGVFWQTQNAKRSRPKRLARDVFVTRLHVRYTSENFPNDFRFRETTDRTNFQGRYILRHPWQGSRSQCVEAEQYLSGLPQRFETEASTLANLTGWNIHHIREKMASTDQRPPSRQLIKPINPVTPSPRKKWYQKLWQQ